MRLIQLRPFWKALVNVRHKELVYYLLPCLIFMNMFAAWSNSFVKNKRLNVVVIARPSPGTQQIYYKENGFYSVSSDQFTYFQIVHHASRKLSEGFLCVRRRWT